MVFLLFLSSVGVGADACNKGWEVEQEGGLEKHGLEKMKGAQRWVYS